MRWLGLLLLILAASIAALLEGLLEPFGTARTEVARWSLIFGGAWVALSALMLTTKLPRASKLADLSTQGPTMTIRPFARGYSASRVEILATSVTRVSFRTAIVRFATTRHKSLPLLVSTWQLSGRSIDQFGQDMRAWARSRDDS